MKDVVEYLQSKGYGDVDEVEVMPENVRFGLPPEIVQAIASAPRKPASHTRKSSGPKRILARKDSS